MSFWAPNGTDGTLQFSEMASFRLCTQGLRALEQYENSASEEDLRLAEENLGKCVQKFPSDVLPKFYLGTVKTLKGYRGLDEAKLLFSDVMKEGDPSLAFAAKYNLAIANVEQYTDKSFSEAQRLLEELVLVREKPRERSIEKTVWSAKATLLYIRAHRLWKTREEAATDDSLLLALRLLEDLDAFRGDLEKSEFASDRDALSDYWNARGAVHEYLAFASGDEKARNEASNLAKTDYQHAVEQKVDYVNSYSNLARLEGDVFGRDVEARKMWESLLNLGKDEYYIRYNLGKISEREGKREEAIQHYAEAAPEIPEAAAALKRLNATKLKNRYHTEVNLKAPKVPYRETIRGGADVQGRHKKQSGGHGQFGDCKIKMEPLPRGGNFEFVNEIFGGAIPKNYITAVEKGIVEAAQRGFLAGFPVVDFRVILYDGSYHDVDSNELSFKAAGRIAFRKAMEQAKPTLLEPIMNVEITIPDEFAGSIMGDLNSRRGRIQGMENKAGKTIVKAEVPMAEMLTYGTDLTSLTQGRGSFAMEMDHYDVVPQAQQEKIISAAKAERGEEVEEIISAAKAERGEEAEEEE